MLCDCNVAVVESTWMNKTCSSAYRKENDQWSGISDMLENTKWGGP